jgi:PIN domain nuclease of toxin-antitoxin system
MILLDTSSWLWWVSDPRHLSARALKIIEDEEKRQAIVVSSISAWEIAVKVAIGKLRLDRDVRSWIALAASYPGISVLPLDSADAVESTLLPGRFHKDPADRILIAIARRLSAALVTRDTAIRRYRHVKTIW